ncbi:MAG: hypothetical protein K8T10_07940 [Candidatus Eremiobacteraeota bacterium]|nr:hypothetical protein [Candidatus Eremiobacteraeota bacterium]
MKRSVMYSIILLLFMFMTKNCFGWSDMLDGKPTIVKGKDQGVFFWVDKEGFHLRFTGTGEKHVFWGIIGTEKKMNITKKIGFQKEDIFKKKGDKEIRYLIKIKKGQIKGFDFKTKSTNMFFVMKIDGRKVMKKDILGGKKKVPFENTPFKIFDIKPGDKGLPFKL